MFDFTEPIAHCPARQPAVSPERLEALDLDRVAHGGPGGVAFDQVDVGRAPARLLIGQPHGAELALAAGASKSPRQSLDSPAAATRP